MRGSKSDLVKAIRSGDHVVVFDGQSMRLGVTRLVKVPEPRYTLPLRQPAPIRPLDPTPGTGQHLICTAACDDGEETGAEPEATRKKVLGRLTLNVANTCPLACRYCYAGQGVYDGPRMLMEPATALSAVNWAVRRFSNIRHVHFFGGEPALNRRVIGLVCEYCRYLYTRGILRNLPSFGLTTSGYVIGERLLEMLKEYKLTVTVSLDGPKQIHDALRVTKRGTGSYDRVARAVDRIAGLGISPEIESTYTAEHLRRGMDVIGLMDFFHDRFGCRVLHCPPVITHESSPWFVPLGIAEKVYSAAIAYSVHNLAVGVSKAISPSVRMLVALNNNTPIADYCPAGRSAITVNADGHVYSCFMLMPGEDLCLGHVSSSAHGGEWPEPLARLLTQADKWSNPACESCWARSLCFGCLGDDLARQGSDLHRSEVPGVSRICDFKRAMAEAFLKSLADICVSQLHDPDPTMQDIPLEEHEYAP